MARTSSKQLDQMAAHISRVTGIPVAVSWAYGRPRLESADGSRDISPRLQSGQLMDWMRAFLDGWQAARGYGAGAKENPRRRAAKRAAKRSGRPIKQLERQHRMIFGKRAKRNPLLGIFGANPRARVVRELGRVVEVRYKRKDDGGLYFHKYSSKPRLLALSDGSIWIKGA